MDYNEAFALYFFIFSFCERIGLAAASCPTNKSKYVRSL